MDFSLYSFTFALLLSDKESYVFSHKGLNDVNTVSRSPFSALSSNETFSPRQFDIYINCVFPFLNAHFLFSFNLQHCCQKLNRPYRNCVKFMEKS